MIFDQINMEELRREVEKEKVMRLLKEQVRKNEEIISELQKTSDDDGRKKWRRRQKEKEKKIIEVE